MDCPGIWEGDSLGHLLYCEWERRYNRRSPFPVLSGVTAGNLDFLLDLEALSIWMTCMMGKIVVFELLVDTLLTWVRYHLDFWKELCPRLLFYWFSSPPKKTKQNVSFKIFFTLHAWIWRSSPLLWKNNHFPSGVCQMCGLKQED